MGKIQKRLNPWVVQMPTSTTLHTALRYIETGDVASLESIKLSRKWEYWRSELCKAMDPPSKCDDEDRRALHALARSGGYPELAEWVSQGLARETPEEDFHKELRDTLSCAGMTDPEIAALTAAYFRDFQRAGRLNSAGRYVLGLTDLQLRDAVKNRTPSETGYLAGMAPFMGLLDFLFAAAPERLDAIAPILLDPKTLNCHICELMLKRGGERFESHVAESWRLSREVWTKFLIAQALVAHNRARYRAEALEFCRSALAGKYSTKIQGDAVWLWLVPTYGVEVLDELCGWLKQRGDDRWSVTRLLDAAVQTMGKEAMPVILLGIDDDDETVRKNAVSHLIKLDDGSRTGSIKAAFEYGIEEAIALSAQQYQPWKSVIEWLNLAAKWRPGELESRLWAFSEHKSKPVRDASARALGRIGEEIVPKVVPILSDKKAARRAWAVTLLTTVGSPAALNSMEARLDVESDDEIRDAMLLAIEASREAVGRGVTRDEIAERVTRAARKLQQPPAAWLDESRLPPLVYADGTPLGHDTTRFLLYRQSRAKEIAADVEARPLYAMIDRGSSGDFALELFKQFVAAGSPAADRWVLAIAGLLGDDRIVPPLNSLVQQWTDAARGKMAEYGVQALALLGTDAALTTVDALAFRYRTKNKNIGAAATLAFQAAAERLGVTTDELGDRVVPWLGFEPGKPRIVECGGKRLQVSIGPQYKLTYLDVEKNKPVSSLPKSASKEILAEFKNLAVILRDVIKGQKTRLENLMVRQHRWPAARWRELFLDHPLLFPFATHLVWGAYGTDKTLVGTFRPLDDRTLSAFSDEPFELPDDASAGIVHPLELDEETRTSWRTHLADYEVISPFTQLERAGILVRDDQRGLRMSRDFRGTSLNALTFRSRAEKQGWSRGSVTDAGGVDAYHKVFPGAGVDAFLGLEGMNVVSGMTDTTVLQDLYFVRGGSVKVGSYVYDSPGDESDERLIPFGDVPPVVFSEVMGDLARIAGHSGEGEGSGDD